MFARSLRLGTGAAVLAAGLVFNTAQPVAACLPIDPPADYAFADGIAFGFAGTVVQVRDDPDLVVPRVEVVIQVDSVIAGEVASRVSLVRGNPYCDSLLYDIGDRLVVAGGVPGPEGPFGLWSEEFEPGPPYNKYQVAVWGPFRPDGTTPHRIGPTLNGEEVPRDAIALIGMLAALPDTALEPAGPPVVAIGLLLVLAAVIAGQARGAGSPSSGGKGGGHLGG